MWPRWLRALSRRSRGSAFTWWTPITFPACALLASALIASVAAPEFRANSVRFVGRLTAALLLFTLVANTITSQRLARQVIAMLLGAAALVGVIAVLELAQVPVVLDGLKLFRPGFHVVGGQVRATSTLFYPTITSMYLEVVFALGLVWIASSRLAFVALVLTGAGIIATFTRAGLITMTMSLLIYGGLVYYKGLAGTRQPGMPRAEAAKARGTGEHTRLAALAAVLLALVLVSRSPQMLVTRMSTDVSQDWYGASYQVPAALTLRPDSFTDVPVTLSNRGFLTWQSTRTPVFALSYHWLSIDTEEVVIYDGLRTAFTHPVEPGEDSDRAGTRPRARVSGNVSAGLGHRPGESHVAESRRCASRTHDRDRGRPGRWWTIAHARPDANRRDADAALGVVDHGPANLRRTPGARHRPR